MNTSVVRPSRRRFAAPQDDVCGRIAKTVVMLRSAPRGASRSTQGGA